jgi:hypothetical protein
MLQRQQLAYRIFVAEQVLKHFPQFNFVRYDPLCLLILRLTKVWEPHAPQLQQRSDNERGLSPRHELHIDLRLPL